MRKIIVVFSLFLISFAGHSQGTELKNHFFTGGSLGLRFGTLTNIEVSPAFGYHINDYLSAGIGGTYQFYNNKYYYPSLRLNIWGGRAFFRVHPFSMIYLQGEYEIMTYKTDIFHPAGEMENIISENILGGIAYRDVLSETVSYYMMLMYNFNQTIYTPYLNPVYRVGIEIAFPARKNSR
ncbi:MAG: hypothetical protein C0592_00415 [Marinilabiliales bacterium]|nr:MAG: hypothetical protein C0592_00415 [Marinilabiliales bacterium]